MSYKSLPLIIKCFQSVNSKTLIVIALSALVAVSYCVWNFSLIRNGHFHEDAYIMFIYVQNILSGYGEVFYPGGPPAEGATDFLWLVLLCCLGLLGVDPGSSAIILNSLGVFVINLLILLCLVKKIDGLACVWFSPWLLVCLFSESLVAALGGFSVFLYSALCLCLLYALQERKHLHWVPIVALVLGLFRPDGVIVGFVAFFIGVFVARGVGNLKKYLAVSCVSLFFALLYFGIRVWYFEEILPLPLYVKSGGPTFSGLSQNLDWLESNSALLVALLIVGVVSGKIKDILILLFPFVALFVALFFATQSQNVGFRFQGPVFFASIYLLFCCLVDWYARSQRQISRVIVVGVSVLCVLVIGAEIDRNIKKSSRKVDRHNYINQFSFSVREIIPRTSTVILTEAGRMAFWNQHVDKIVDMIGLNTVYPAKNKVDLDYIASLDPDVIMFHHAYMLDVSEIEKKHKGRLFVLLENDDRSNFIAEDRYAPELWQTDKVFVASVELIGFLRGYFEQYFVYLVDYRADGTFRHVYGFKKSVFNSSEIERRLSDSFSCEGECLSYFDMIAKLEGDR